jgi:hypothetical protein
MLLTGLAGGSLKENLDVKLQIQRTRSSLAYQGVIGLLRTVGTTVKTT